MTDHYILITRPAEKAEKTADMVVVAGFKPLVAPMFVIKPVEAPALPDDFSRYRALVLTSPSAASVLAGMTKDRKAKIYTVGDDTAAEAKGQGWQDIVSAGGTAEDLVLLLQEEKRDEKGRPFLHLSGRHVSYALDEDDRINVERQVIYEAVKTDILSPECVRLIKEKKIKAVLFYSARTAENFERLVDMYDLADDLCSIKALCIGKRVVKSLRKELWQDVHCARTPDSEGMEALISTTLRTSPP